MRLRGLDRLLLDLQQRGIAVGPMEVDRIGRLLVHGPQLGKTELRELLVCVLITGREQRPAVEVVFEEWWRDATAQMEHAAEASRIEEDGAVWGGTSSAIDVEPAVAVTRFRNRRRALMTLAALLVLVDIALVVGLRTPTRTALDSPVAVDSDGELELPREPRFLPVPDEVLPDMRMWVDGARQVPLRFWIASLLPLSIGFGLWLLDRLRRRLPDGVVAPLPDSPDWEPWLVAGESTFLSPEQRRRIVFAVDRRVHESPSHRLDLARTARETARQAGLPVLVYEPVVTGREVWFWIDQPAWRRSDIRAFIEDVEQSLQQVGLPFERAHFAGLPDRLFSPPRRESSPATLESARHEATVVILTDGEGIRQALRAGDQHARVSRLLRELADWPRLIVADIDADRHRSELSLKAVLAPLGLRCVPPRDLFEILAARGVAPTVPSPVRVSARQRAVAGAIAVSWERVAPPVARELVDRLWPGYDPFEVEGIAREIELDPSRRADALNDLLSAERDPNDGSLASYSTAARATEFFTERLTRASGGDEPPTREAAAQWREMEGAMLRLLQEPAAAATALYRLHRGSSPRIRDEIRARLGTCRARGLLGLAAAAPRGVVLPWSWTEQSGRTQQMLAACGFGRIGALRLRPAGRRVAAIGSLLAWAVALCFGGYLDYQAAPRERLPRLVPAREAWNRAVEAIADVDRFPAYGGLTLAPREGGDQEGDHPGPFAYREDLHPLGPDRASGLWEFAIRGSGTIPARDAEGALVLGSESAVVMVLLPGGTFAMGSQKKDEGAPNYFAGAIDNEAPVHDVVLSPFFIGKHEFTTHQWFRLTGLGDESGGNVPVVGLSWDDIQSVLSKLPYALPTEAQWEYACRAESNTAWCFGDDDATLEEYAWYDKNSEYEVHPVGKKLPNAFGLYDMHGNVWEWCSDWYGKYAANPAGSAANVAADPTGPDTGASRVLRGGFYWVDAVGTRSACRGRDEPGSRLVSFGFRVSFPARAVRSRP